MSMTKTDKQTENHILQHISELIWQDYMHGATGTHRGATQPGFEGIFEDP